MILAILLLQLKGAWDTYNDFNNQTRTGIGWVYPISNGDGDGKKSIPTRDEDRDGLGKARMGTGNHISIPALSHCHVYPTLKSIVQFITCTLYFFMFHH